MTRIDEKFRRYHSRKPDQESLQEKSFTRSLKLRSLKKWNQDKNQKKWLIDEECTKKISHRSYNRKDFEDQTDRTNPKEKKQRRSKRVEETKEL